MDHCQTGRVSQRPSAGVDLSPILFSIFNYFHDGLKALLLKHVASPLEDRIRIQNDLDILARWSKINKMKFNKDKCKHYI